MFFPHVLKCSCLLQAQWEYFDNSNYEPYPEDINIIIENAYQEKKPYAEWEEDEDARYRLTFETMEEEMVNNASSKVKVRRNTKGNVLPTENTSFRGKRCRMRLSCCTSWLQTSSFMRLRGLLGLNLMTLPWEEHGVIAFGNYLLLVKKLPVTYNCLLVSVHWRIRWIREGYHFGVDWQILATM